MRMMLAIAATPFLLTACMEDMPRPVPGGPPPRECRNMALGQFVGREMTPRLHTRLRRASGARDVRVVRPGEAVTMDFRADRLTVYVGPRGRIDRLSCG